MTSRNQSTMKYVTCLDRTPGHPTVKLVTLPVGGSSTKNSFVNWKPMTSPGSIINRPPVAAAHRTTFVCAAFSKSTKKVPNT